MTEKIEREFAIIDAQKNGKPLIGQVNLYYENFTDKAKFPYCLYLNIPLKKDEMNDNWLPVHPYISQTCYDAKDFLFSHINGLSKTHFVTHHFHNEAFHVYMYLDAVGEVSSYLNSMAYQPKEIRNFSFKITEDKNWNFVDFIFNKNQSIENDPELKAHLNRNLAMWEEWKNHGITEKTKLTVLFHFYASKKGFMEALCSELEQRDVEFDVEKTRTMIFLKGWKINAKISKMWTLPELQEKTERMFLLAKQTETALEGCGAFMPKK